MAVDQDKFDPLFSPRLVPEQDPADVIAAGGTPIWPNASFLSFGSDWSSPAESEQGSSRSGTGEDDEDDDGDGEEDDYIAELTHRMAQYMLQDEEKHENTWGFSGSPQSTLWSPLGSDQESSTGPSREPSPTIENFDKAATNKVDEQIGSPNPSFQSKQALIDYQIRASQYYRLKQEQAMKKVSSDQKVGSNGLYALHQKQRNQQPSGSDNMRAVFLSTSGSKNNSCGTGVFLPRSASTTTCQEPRIKQGCSTVLIPARVVQALKLHFEKTGVPSRLDTGSPLPHDAFGSGRMHQHNTSLTYSQQKRRLKTAPATKRQEISLPQEWTY